jgi:hypothetical protein
VGHVVEGEIGLVHHLALLGGAQINLLLLAHSLLWALAQNGARRSLLGIH